MTKLEMLQSQLSFLMGTREGFNDFGDWDFTYDPDVTYEDGSEFEDVQFELIDSYINFCVGECREVEFEPYALGAQEMMINAFTSQPEKHKHVTTEDIKSGIINAAMMWDEPIDDFEINPLILELVQLKWVSVEGVLDRQSHFSTKKYGENTQHFTYRFCGDDDFKHYMINLIDLDEELGHDMTIETVRVPKDKINIHGLANAVRSIGGELASEFVMETCASLGYPFKLYNKPL